MKTWYKYCAIPFVIIFLSILFQIGTVYNAKLTTFNLFLDDIKSRNQLEKMIEENADFLRNPGTIHEDTKREFVGDVIVQDLNHKTTLMRLLSLRKDWLYQNALVDCINLGRVPLFIVGILLAGQPGVMGFKERSKKFTLTILVGALSMLILSFLVHWTYYSTSIAGLPLTEFVLEKTNPIHAWSPTGTYIILSFLGLSLTWYAYGLMGYLVGRLVKNTLIAVLLAPLLNILFPFLLVYPLSPIYFWDKSIGLLVFSGEVVGFPGKDTLHFGLLLVFILVLMVINFSDFRSIVKNTGLKKHAEH